MGKNLRLILVIGLLACTIVVSCFTYSIYMQENITEQEGYKIGEAILRQTTRYENPVIELRDSGRVWYVHALCKFETQYPYTADYFVEISKRTGKVVRVGYDYIPEED